MMNKSRKFKKGGIRKGRGQAGGRTTRERPHTHRHLHPHRGHGDDGGISPVFDASDLGDCPGGVMGDCGCNAGNYTATCPNGQGCCGQTTCGCDSVCGSSTTIDECGVCGGNGSTCGDDGWDDTNTFGLCFCGQTVNIGSCEGAITSGQGGPGNVDTSCVSFGGTPCGIRESKGHCLATGGQYQSEPPCSWFSGQYIVPNQGEWDPNTFVHGCMNGFIPDCSPQGPGGGDACVPTPSLGGLCDDGDDWWYYYRDMSCYANDCGACGGGRSTSGKGKRDGTGRGKKGRGKKGSGRPLRAQSIGGRKGRKFKKGGIGKGRKFKKGGIGKGRSANSKISRGRKGPNRPSAKIVGSKPYPRPTPGHSPKPPYTKPPGSGYGPDGEFGDTWTGNLPGSGTGAPCWSYARDWPAARPGVHFFDMTCGDGPARMEEKQGRECTSAGCYDCSSVGCDDSCIVYPNGTMYPWWGASSSSSTGQAHCQPPTGSGWQCSPHCGCTVEENCGSSGPGPGEDGWPTPNVGLGRITFPYWGCVDGSGYPDVNGTDCEWACCAGRGMCHNVSSTNCSNPDMFKNSSWTPGKYCNSSCNVDDVTGGTAGLCDCNNNPSCDGTYKSYNRDCCESSTCSELASCESMGLEGSYYPDCTNPDLDIEPEYDYLCQSPCVRDAGVDEADWHYTNCHYGGAGGYACGTGCDLEFWWECGTCPYGQCICHNCTTCNTFNCCGQTHQYNCRGGGKTRSAPRVRGKKLQSGGGLRSTRMRNAGHTHRPTVKPRVISQGMNRKNPTKLQKLAGHGFSKDMGPDHSGRKINSYCAGIQSKYQCESPETSCQWDYDNTMCI
jgi:hypothetical protein